MIRKGSSNEVGALEEPTMQFKQLKNENQHLSE
jgi:hypothetical protein